MTINPGFQVSLDVQGRMCVVIGGDDEAEEKINRLLDAGAKVVVVNPTFNPSIRKLTASGKVIHRGRRFRSTDTQGAFLILNVVRDDNDLSQSLFELAKVERFLVWSIDQPELSTFVMTALVSRGHFRLAISTSGASPALASLLRQQNESIFDDDFCRFLDWLGDMRQELQQKEPHEGRRREQLKAAVEGFTMTGAVTYPAGWLEAKKTQDTQAEKVG